jgi:hypothetical protein
MTWEKKPALTGGRIVGCFNCGYKPEYAPLDMRIAVGFGCAVLTCDGRIVWSEDDKEYEDCMSVEQAEVIAVLNPDHDWQIRLYGPLSEAVYQRHEANMWALIETGMGFA